MLSPSQLRSLRVEALQWSEGVMVDELGWSGENATTRLVDMEQGRRELNLPTAKHAIRIGREHGFTLNSQGHWQPISTRGEGK